MDIATVNYKLAEILFFFAIISLIIYEGIQCIRQSKDEIVKNREMLKKERLEKTK